MKKFLIACVLASGIAHADFEDSLEDAVTYFYQRIYYLEATMKFLQQNGDYNSSIFRELRYERDKLFFMIEDFEEVLDSR